MGNIRDDLSDIIERWNLLEHPFYKAWSAGMVPVEAIKTYAREYGTFIARLADGWEAVGHTEHADEERHHAVLWADFATALGTHVAEPKIPEMRALLDTCESLFADPDTAWGALYAFEVQQPVTTATKLEGLNAFYEVSPEGKAYFEVHANDTYESVIILDHLDDAGEEARARAIEGCEVMSRALWEALSGVYQP